MSARTPIIRCDPGSSRRKVVLVIAAPAPERRLSSNSTSGGLTRSYPWAANVSISRATTRASISASGGRRSYMPLGSSAGCGVSFIAPQFAPQSPSGTPGKRTCPRARARIPALKPQRLDLDDIGEGANGVEHHRGERLIDLDQGDGVLPRSSPPEMEGGDVDLGGAERIAEGADETGLVVVAHEQHVAAEL